MRSRYQTMALSITEFDPDGNAYPDVMTFPIDLFSYSQTTITYSMSQNDIDRPDKMVSTYYGIAEFDDIVLWLSDIPFVYDESPGKQVELPRKRDMERFFAQFTE